MNSSRISVITPSFNQGAFLERTIDSVLSQGYGDLEYIIIDGGSTDNSVDIIKRHAKHISYWVSEKDRGQSHALNKGFARATGCYISWLNSDDWYEPDALSVFVECFKENPQAGMIIGAGQILDQNGKLIYDIPPPKRVRSRACSDGWKGTIFSSLRACSLARRSNWQARLTSRFISLLMLISGSAWRKPAFNSSLHRDLPPRR